MHGGLKEKGENNVICGANDTVGFPVLLGSMGTREVKMNTIGEEEDARGCIVKLAAIVALDAFNACVELGFGVCKEMCECGKYIELDVEEISIGNE